jgi:hypothetical protein
MKYVKMLGLLAVAAAALMAFEASASATTLTSPPGTTYTSWISASSEGATTLHGPATITCNSSTMEGRVEQHGGNGVRAGGWISNLSFSSCGSNDVSVKSTGWLEVETKNESPDGNGTVFSTSAEISVNVTSLGITCVYSTAFTDIGTLTGSNSTGSNATLDINSSSIPRTGGSIFCGSSAKWTGSYKITTPSELVVV